MSFKSEKIILKNGKEAILRTPKVEDAMQLIDLIKTLAGETEFIMKYPEECTMTIEQEEAFIQSLNDSPYQEMIVCEIDGEIVGNCEISFNNRIKTKHRATIGIGIKKAYWNLGLGTIFFERLINIATNYEGVKFINLEFVEGNERGLHLYEKMGFELVGYIPNGICLKDGTLLRMYQMVKTL